jgi:uncharacterized protein YgiB involved in biofilm formation
VNVTIFLLVVRIATFSIAGMAAASGFYRKPCENRSEISDSIHKSLLECVNKSADQKDCKSVSEEYLKVLFEERDCKAKEKA